MLSSFSIYVADLNWDIVGLCAANVAVNSEGDMTFRLFACVLNYTFRRPSVVFGVCVMCS